MAIAKRASSPPKVEKDTRGERTRKKIKKTICGPEDCPVRLLPEICRVEKKTVKAISSSGFAVDE